MIEIFGKAYISSQVADAICLCSSDRGTSCKTYRIVRQEHPGESIRCGRYEEYEQNNQKQSDQLWTGIVLFVIVTSLSATGNLSNLLMGLMVPLCVYTIASISLNLVVGFSGELSLGHAGFMCVGAYSSALFSHVASDIPQVPRFILAILVGAAVAAVFGVIIGIPVLRLRGDYLAIVTLAFGEIIKNLINILYVGIDDSGLHVATSSAALKLGTGGKQILKGALGISGTGALYKDVKHYFFRLESYLSF